MRYYPKELEGSDYLKTLLHTDYLLKMFSQGVEINSQTPFEIRSVYEGLLHRLPLDLARTLRPI